MTAGALAAAPSADRRAVAAWALYDLADSVFFINVVSLYFPLWVVDDAGGRDVHYAVANSASMALIFLLAPLLGALSDHAPRRMPFLVASALGCAALTALLGAGGLLPSLLLFALANGLFQAGTVFYDALLPAVSAEANRGRISGLGASFGLGGAIVGILIGLAVLSFDDAAKPLVFKLTALVYLLAALPCFLWVREPPRATPAPGRRLALQAALGDVRGSLERIRSAPGMGRFLLGRVCYTDAANTILAFMGVYASQEIGFSDLQVQLVLLVGIVAGPLGALTAGRWVDRIGPRRTLLPLLGLWIVVLAIAAAVPALDLPVVFFWLVAPLAGLAVAATATTDRVLLLRLAPARHLGQFVGLFGTVNRFSAIVGPLLWALIVDGLDLGRPAAVVALIVMVALALVILRPLDDRPHPVAAP